MIKTVKLNNVRFYARHGFFEEEQKTGNNFIVNVEVSQHVESLTDSLSETIDYSSLYVIIKDEMEVTSKLLEDVIQRILQKIEIEWSNLNEVIISIKKQSPPFGGNCESSEVRIVKTY